MSRKESEKEYLEYIELFQQKLADKTHAYGALVVKFQDVKKLDITLKFFLNLYLKAFPAECYRYYPSASNVMSFFKGQGRHQYHSHKRANEAQAIFEGLKECEKELHDDCRLQRVQQILAHYILYRLRCYQGKSKIVTGHLFAVVETLLVASARLYKEQWLLRYDRALLIDRDVSRQLEAVLSQSGSTEEYDDYVQEMRQIIDPNNQLNDVEWQVYDTRFLPGIRTMVNHPLSKIDGVPESLGKLLCMSIEELKYQIAQYRKQLDPEQHEVPGASMHAGSVV